MHIIHLHQKSPLDGAWISDKRLKMTAIVYVNEYRLMLKKKIMRSRDAKRIFLSTR